MIKTQNIDTVLLDKAIEDSGLKTDFIVSKLGISRQAFHNKRKGRYSFRLSEVYVLCDLLKIPNDEQRDKIFFPKELSETATGEE